MSLTSKQVRQLKGLAHHLNPVVLVGDKGVSEALIEKVIIELENHELLKVKVAADRDIVTTTGAALCEATGAQLVNQIGKMVILYRRRRDGKPTIQLIDG
jgi:RNA-binding protein